MSEAAIRVEDVAKRYFRGAGSGLAEGFRRMLGRGRPENEVWALGGVSFEVPYGEALGVIGPNGAGKTTLLKLLSGITVPTRGRLAVSGKVSALLEVGAGFHGELTGRENIFLNGAILGIPRREIERRFDDIVEFSELGEFLEMPLKRYSSGMVVRLGFSVAVHVDPEILLIDEVLSVGDAAFRMKCYERARALRDRAGAVVFVSHDMLAVRNFCDRVIWLEEGRVRESGEPGEIVGRYLESARVQVERLILKGGTRTAEVFLNIPRTELLGGDEEPREAFRADERVTVRLHYEAPERIERPRFNVSVSTGDGPPILTASQVVDGEGPEAIEGTGHIDCVFEKGLPLLPGRYQFCGCAYGDGGNVTLLRWTTFSLFSITSEGFGEVPPERAAGRSTVVGPVQAKHCWHESRAADR